MTNDIQANADFFVEVQDAKGYNHLATLLDDGYTPCSVSQPPPGFDLGWQSANFNLNAYKGQFIRLVFSARNLTQGSLGIWANVDNVKVLDMPIILPPPASVHLFFPFVSSRKCQDILSPNFR